MKTKTILSTATALGLILAGAALASDGNTLYLDQDGENNTALVIQDVPNFTNEIGGNNIGTDSDPVTQQGDGNEFYYDNGTGVSNGGVGNNDIIKAEQIGNGNYMRFHDQGGSDTNLSNNIQQIGDDNYANFSHNSADDSVVDVVLQEGDDNFLRIQQEAGTGNKVLSATQIGSRNGASAVTTASMGTYIYQRGSGNLVTEASITGSDNGGINNRALYILQRGNNNGQGLSVASMLGSNGNNISVEQVGDGNDFGIWQGTSTASTGNDAKVTQDGNFNYAKVTQFGNGNEIFVDQDGNSNITTANFTGNGNGVDPLSGDAGDLAAAHTELTQGTIFQDAGTTIGGNQVNYDVTGDDNLFAFAQIGGSNVIDGTVIGNGNQVAVLQYGSGNNTTFTQIGNFNNLGVSQ
ncbi:hypothetical protein [Hoeflea sp.]|uniref:hypothetical protein n=1 Tax=Hoeflea sp. TaxID=1940281 RepID=UPI003A8C9B4D